MGASDQSYREIYQLAAKYDRPVWCLEAGSDAGAYKLSPSVWPTWNYALEVAQAYAKTIGEARAEVVDYWTYRDDFPLVDKADKPYPVYEVLRQFNDAFGAGTRIVEATSSGAETRVLAGVRAEGTMVAMLINPVGAGEVTLRGWKPNAAALIRVLDGNGRRIELPRTARADNKGAVSFVLPARCIVVVNEQ